MQTKLKIKGETGWEIELSVEELARQIRLEDIERLYLIRYDFVEPKPTEPKSEWCQCKGEKFFKERCSECECNICGKVIKGLFREIHPLEPQPKQEIDQISKVDFGVSNKDCKTAVMFLANKMNELINVINEIRSHNSLRAERE